MLYKNTIDIQYNFIICQSCNSKQLYIVTLQIDYREIIIILNTYDIKQKYIELII